MGLTANVLQGVCATDSSPHSRVVGHSGALRCFPIHLGGCRGGTQGASQ